MAVPRRVRSRRAAARSASRPRWSPDSKKLAFSDKTRTLWWCDVAGGKLTRVDKSEFGEIHDYTWAGDSRWIAYSRPGANNFSRIALYSVDRNQVTTVSNGMTDDFGPAFDQGRYLFFVSRRTIDLPAFQYEYAFPYAETDKLYAMTLRDTTASPVAPRSDEEDGVAAGDDAKDSKDGKDSSKSKASDKDKEHEALGDRSRRHGRARRRARGAGRTLRRSRRGRRQARVPGARSSRSR